MRFAFALLSLTICSGLLASPAAAAVDREQRAPTPSPSGLLAVTPNRVEIDVVPGERTPVQIELFNDDPEDTVDVSMLTADLGPAANPASVADRIEDGEFGAGDWISFEIDAIRLKPFEAITFLALIDTPANAPVGTNLGAISVRATAAAGAVGALDDGGAVKIDALIQMFLNVPGPVKHDLRITDVDVRDSLLIGSTRFAVYDVEFRNEGTLNEHVSGSVDIKSIFGSSAHREKIEDLIVLRGATRTTRVVWRDVPWVGVFTPEARMRGDDAKLITRGGERIYIMPWWLPILVVIALLLPPAIIWWRRRQEWKLYLEDDQFEDGYAPLDQ